MNMFSIRFTDEPLTGAEPGEEGLVGIINLDGFDERFVSHLWTWSRPNYGRHWRVALWRALDAKPSALITDMCTPEQRSHLVWWPMWKVDTRVVFHNQLLFFPRHGIRTIRGTAEDLFEFIGARETHNAEGNPLSEWSVPAQDIELFLKNEQGS